MPQRQWNAVLTGEWREREFHGENQVFREYANWLAFSIPISTTSRSMTSESANWSRNASPRKNGLKAETPHIPGVSGGAFSHFPSGRDLGENTLSSMPNSSRRC